MNKKINKIISSILVLCLLLPSATSFAAFEDKVFNIVTTFIGDAGTERGFSWTALSDHTDMVIQYAPKYTYWAKNKIEVRATYETYSEYPERIFYKVDISDLTPGTEYIYRIGDTTDNIWSKMYSFKTEDENIESFKFIGITDAQGDVWENDYVFLQNTMTAATTAVSDIAFIADIGDETNDGQNENHWDLYFKAMKGISEKIPLMTVVGNHETRGNEVTAGKNYSLHFNNPNNGADALGSLTASDVEHECTKGVVNNISESVYSFDYGNAHFAVLNTGTDWHYEDTIKILSKQAEWLEKDMNASSKKWKIVMFHQGMYPANIRSFSTKSALLEVIDKCNIDLVLSGHDHIVSRTYPMKNNLATSFNTDVIQKGEGTVYTILGSSGIKRLSVASTLPEYSAVLNVTNNSLPSYTVFEVTDDSINVITKQINDTVVDRYSITDTE